MVKKRRTFDIDIPEEDTPSPVPEPERRRGPMASAIRETAESARARQDIEARIRAENDALAFELVDLREKGLVVELVPLDAIHVQKLTRDRAMGEDPELEELTESIRAVGLSNPIRLEAAGEGAYELVQGFRRLSAYRALLAETGDAETYGRIPAAVMRPGETMDGLYRRMVDENLVRKDISFAEMAQLAIAYAADPQVAETDPDRAVADLFKSAGYQKRSYIRGFIKLMLALGHDVSHPTEIPRALGTALVKKIEAAPALAVTIRGELARVTSAEDELAILRRHAGEALDRPEKPRAPRPGSKAKTSFQFDRGEEGRAKCTASAGRLEVRLDRDFSSIDPRKLERAVREMLDKLD